MTIESFITSLCKHSGVAEEHISVEVTSSEDEKKLFVTISVPSEDSGLFIGYHGETLDAIQRVARIVFQEKYPDQRVLVNINQYREQREEKLKEKAFAAAEHVLSTGREYVLEGLSSQERFIIHSAISENQAFSELHTISEGEGRDRVLIVRFKDSAESQ